MAQARKEALSTQALQILDGFLVWLAFWIGAQLRDPVREILGLNPDGGLWPGAILPVLFVVIPLTPIALEAFGFIDIRCASGPAESLPADDPDRPRGRGGGRDHGDFPEGRGRQPVGSRIGGADRGVLPVARVSGWCG